MNGWAQRDAEAREDEADEIEVLRKDNDYLSSRVSMLEVAIETWRQEVAVLQKELKATKDALTPKPPREGIYPWAIPLQKTANYAQYWIEGGRNEPNKGRAILCVEQAVNGWKNACYSYAEQLYHVTDYDFSGVIALTHSKAKDIIARDTYQITGFVLTHDDGRKCVVDMSAVRWFSKQEFFSMMHGIKTNTGDQA